VVSSFAAAGGALSLFFMAVLLTKKPAAPADKWLFSWLACQLIFFGSIGTAGLVPDSVAVPVLLMGQFVLFLSAPCQFLFAAELFNLRRRWRLHTASAASVAVLLLAPFAAAGSVDPLSGGIVADEAPRWLLGAPLLAIAIVAAYPLAILVRRPRHNIGRGRRRADFVPAQGWVAIWACCTLAAALFLMLIQLGWFAAGWAPHLQIVFALAAQAGTVAFVGYHGFVRAGIFVGGKQGRQPPSAYEAEPAEDSRRLAAVMEAKKPFLDPRLTVQALAELLGWAPERLGRAFRHDCTNFFDAVSAARVREVQRLAALPQHDDTPLLTLGMDAGFGSKSAFYEAFKRHAGCAPAEWRRRYQVSAAGIPNPRSTN